MLHLETVLSAAGFAVAAASLAAAHFWKPRILSMDLDGPVTAIIAFSSMAGLLCLRAVTGASIAAGVIFASGFVRF